MFYSFLFASFLLSQNYVWIADADSTACTDGMLAGRKETEKLWEKTYKSNCQYVTEFANEVNGMYKTGGDKSYNTCAEIEAEKVVNEKFEECLTPGFCSNQGREAAAIVMAIYTAPYCVVASSTSAKPDPTIDEMCRDYAISSCKTYLPEAYQEIRAISDCSKDIEKYITWDLLPELQAECEDMVNMLIP